MFGQNPKRPPLYGDGNILEVKNIFKTIQGEGPFAGEPAVFIRLGGCNLACSFCDTEFENFKTSSLQTVIDEVLKFSLNSQNIRIIKLVVITGGEPLRQPIEKLCQKLIDLEFKVQIETNGTLYRPLPGEVHIVCSPKASSQGYNLIREDLLKKISAIKFLIAKDLNAYNNISEIGQTKFNIPVFIQPIDQNDEKLNRENTELAIKLALESGNNISVQIHKFLNIE
jgi:7-carboxy-7-deazaguanine synthase